jgi:hypothetical protein
LDENAGKHCGPFAHWESPAPIQHALNKLVTGDISIHPPVWFMRHYGPFEHVAELGCGEGILVHVLLDGDPGLTVDDALERFWERAFLAIPAWIAGWLSAAQMLACHNASMYCYAIALNSNTTGLRHEDLNQVGKLSRTFAMLLDALNRHRGKGMQKITVEHVYVHSGGQTVVGVVEAPGGGVRPKSENQPNGKRQPPTHL